MSLATLEAIDLLRVEDEGLGALRRETVAGLWRPLLRCLGPDRDATTLSVGDVLGYVGSRRRGQPPDVPGVRGQTIRREVQALVRALKIAKRDRVISALPFDPEDLPQIRSDPPLAAQRGKLWHIDQIEDVLAWLSAKAVTAGHLDRCRLILLTGLRLEELHRLQPQWVVHGINTPTHLAIPAEAAKWGKARLVPLCDVALEIISRCAPFARRKPNKSLALASLRAGLPGVLTPRDLRVFYLDLSARLSGDPVAAQRLGGHRSIATTGLYLQADTGRALAAGLAAATWICQHPPQQVATAQGGEAGNATIAK